jgi:ubiquinone/menaquinone biosynthesis C-methylase UbiE
VAYDGRDRMSDGPEFFEQRRTSFGAYAGTYDATRPDWPEPTIDWLVGHRPPGARVLDLGAGTGKGTLAVAALGLAPTAVDPSPEMLAQLQARQPGVPVVVGAAESIPLPDNSFDAVICLQAWHWFDSPAAARECARVLGPDGSLGIAWHVRDETVPWVADLSDAAGRREDAVATTRGLLPPGIEGPFEPAEIRVFDYELVLDVDGVVALASSWSYLALADDRDERLAAVRRVAVAAAVDGVVRVPHRTRCFRFRIA